MKKVPVIFIVSLVLILALSSFSLAESNSRDLETMPNSASGSSFLENEAGITVYTKVDSIDLSQVKDAYKNIEKETSEYIIGSVSLADYREESDVHVYTDSSGWIAAYYLKEKPASKIIHWKQYGSSGTLGTKLKRALISITNKLGTPLLYTEYCDFRYPDAEKIMVVTDEIIENSGTETFLIKIPYGFTVYSRSWSLYGEGTSIYSGDYVKIQIDETTVQKGMPEDYPNNWNIWEGTLTQSQLTLGEYHKIGAMSDYCGLSSYVAITLIYSS